MANREAIKNEAIQRIKTLTEKYQLNPHILDYFLEGKVYYSYLTAGGLMASIDTISYDPAYRFSGSSKGIRVFRLSRSRICHSLQIGRSCRSMAR